MATTKTTEYLLSHWRDYCIAATFGGKCWACIDGIINLLKKCPGGQELSVDDAKKIIISNSVVGVVFVPLKELQVELKSAIKERTKLNDIPSLIKALDLCIFEVGDFKSETLLDNDGCQLVIFFKKKELICDRSSTRKTG